MLFNARTEEGAQCPGSGLGRGQSALGSPARGGLTREAKGAVSAPCWGWGQLGEAKERETPRCHSRGGSRAASKPGAREAGVGVGVIWDIWGLRSVLTPQTAPASPRACRGASCWLWQRCRRPGSPAAWGGKTPPGPGGSRETRAAVRMRRAGKAVSPGFLAPKPRHPCLSVLFFSRPATQPGALGFRCPTTQDQAPPHPPPSHQVPPPDLGLATGERVAVFL